MEVKQLRLGAKDDDIKAWLEGKSFSSYVKALIRADMKEDTLICSNQHQEVLMEFKEVKELIKNIKIADPLTIIEEVSATVESNTESKSVKKTKSKKASAFIV